MRAQACVTCARRKIRCDKEEPCFNCKRHDKECVYPAALPSDRIKQLESLVRSLGGDPNDASQDERGPAGAKELGRDTEPSTSTDNASNGQSRNHSAGDGFQASPSGDSAILQVDQQTMHVESFSYQHWHAGEHASRLADQNQKTFIGAPSMCLLGSSPLKGVMKQTEWHTLAQMLPRGHDADVLWAKYRYKVHPLGRLIFDWEVDALQSAATENIDQLSPQQYFLLSAIYLLTYVSLSEDECLQSLNQSKLAVIPELLNVCEQALIKSESFWATDVVGIQALTLYIHAGWDIFSVKSLWFLQGAAVRNAERLGMHRDGTVFGLPPIETERRRRLWWQLQHLEFALTTRAGAMPLTVLSDWDVRLPLNIEDDDLRPDARDFPKERIGLTAMSHCLLVYWSIQKQRSLRRDDGTRFGLAWVTDRTLPRAKREAWLKELEDGVNSRFIQYCEPVKPLHVLLQHIGRSYMWTLRRVMLHSIAQAEGMESDKAVWGELLDACVNCLEYSMALDSSPLTQHFRWQIDNYFDWTALVCLALEAGQRSNLTRAREIWALLSRLYQAKPALSRLWEDRRRMYAAELIVASWKAQDGQLHEKPAFVSNLEAQLPAARPSTTQNDSPERTRRKRKADWPAPVHTKPPPGSEQAAKTSNAPRVQDSTAPQELMFTPSELDVLTDLQFDDVDWDFWNDFS